MKTLLISLVMLVFALSLIPNFLSRKYLSKLSNLLLNDRFDEFYELIDSKKAKLLIPVFNREYLLLNSYILKKNEDKVKETYNVIFNMKLSKKQERVIYLEAFNYYCNSSDKEMIDKIYNHIQSFDEEEIKKDNKRIYDICVLKQANHIEEMEEEYSQTGNKSIAMMLYLQYKNINDKENMKKYEEIIK